jgi:hypothetical protein
VSGSGGGDDNPREHRQDRQVLVEVLHRDRASGAHQVVAAVLQERVHRHHEKAREPADQHHERHREPDVAHSDHHQDDDAHGDADRQHLDRMMQRNPDRRSDRSRGDAERHHALKQGGLRQVEAERGARPLDEDEL